MDPDDGFPEKDSDWSSLGPLLTLVQSAVLRGAVQINLVTQGQPLQRDWIIREKRATVSEYTSPRMSATLPKRRDQNPAKDSGKWVRYTPPVAQRFPAWRTPTLYDPPSFRAVNVKSA